FVVADGREQPPFDGLLAGTLSFGRDGRQLAYAVKNGDRYLVVVNGREERLCDGVLEGTLVFSADCRRVAYGIKTGGRVRVVADGRESPDYDGLFKGSPVFSPDGRHLAYAVKAGDKALVVLDGKETAAVAGTVRDLTFAPDGTRLAYIAGAKDQWRVVADGKEGRRYTVVRDGSLTFSPRGDRLAYVAEAQGRAFAVVDGVEGRHYDEILPGSLTFDADGKRLAYAARDGGRWRIVVDGGEQEPFDAVSAPAFSSGGILAYAARRNGRECVVFDGRPGEEYDRIITGAGGRIVFDTGEFHHYLALQGGALHLVSNYPQAPSAAELEKALAALRGVRMNNLDPLDRWRKLKEIDAACRVVQSSGPAGYLRLKREIETVRAAKEADDFFLLQGAALLWRLGGPAETETIAALWREAASADYYDQVFFTAAEAARTRDPRVLPLLRFVLGETRGQVYLNEHDLQLEWPLTAEILWGAYGPAGLPVLAGIIRESKDAAELQAAVLYLAKAMYLPALPDVRRIAAEGPPEARAAAAIGLGRYGHPADYEFLAAGLRRGVPEEVKASHAYALGLYGDLRAVEPVAPLLASKLPAARLSAISCLSRLIAPESLALLERQSREAKDEWERRLCADAVARFLAVCGLSWREYTRLRAKERAELAREYRDWEYLLRQGERAPSREEFLEALEIWRKSGRVAGSSCGWVETRHILAIAVPDDLDLLLEVEAALYASLSDEGLRDVERLDQVLIRLGRIRYRRDPGVTEKVEGTE
ncbi:MAG: hypothetical protein ACM3XS_00320, partial [Bacteroidota bacterium]